ncbi:Sulfurtransferase [Lysobacter dokdonensis DS-58]|uniref:Sulfurtransferase n=1 Tax=Lysobacter dokdonensis DS-58 TaxID=1300345 RepID=A0A0A2X3J5_9GAMM|nr:sulfurtransferase [Lysobacter dokdonensis]KGQ19809.1 Sulfurtransferase [Lysobacter dokdonensis DS-58]
MSGWNTLVQAETLAIAIGRPDVKLVDCRFTLTNPMAGESAFLVGHLPGAVYAHLDRDLSDMKRTGAGRHPWPDAATFTQKLGEWGIGPDDQVVAYDDGDGSHAARFWVLMRMLGHEKVAVLDGGWSRWTSLGLSVDSTPRKPITTRYTGAFDTTRLLDADQVQQRLAAGELLIDARAADRFRGENEMIDRVAGHVPGAVNRHFAKNLDHGKFKPPADLADEFRELLLGKHADEAMVMCGSGVTACHHLLAMERAGLRGARLFTGSWSGWISDPARPIATGD